MPSVNKTLRMMLLVLMMLAATAASVMLGLSHRDPEMVIGEKTLFNYSSKASWDYKVKIMTGFLFPYETVGPGGIYFENVIDAVSATARYSLKTSPTTPIEGVSSAVGLLRAYDSMDATGKPIWELEYDLLEPSRFAAHNGQATLERSLSVGLAEYRTAVEDLFVLTEVRPSRATLTLQWRVSAYSSEGRPIGEQVVKQLVIPVAAKHFAIDNEAASEDQGSVVVPAEVANGVLDQVRTKWTILTAGLTALTVMLVIFTNPRVPSPNEMAYQTVLAKLGGAVATSVGEPPQAGRVVAIGSPEDLLKVAEELGKPIIGFPMTEPLLSHLFCVLDGDLRYELMFISTDGEGSADGDLGNDGSEDDVVEVSAEESTE